MQLFVLQNGLESRATHYFNESLAWRAVLGERGIGCRLYVNRRAPPAIVAALDAVPVFAFGTDDFVPFDHATQGLHDLVLKSDRFAFDCRLLERHGAGPGDIVVLPYAGGAEMAGLARWLESRKAAMRPRVVAIVHRPGDDWRFDRTRRRVVAGTTGPLRYGALRLSRAAGEARLLLAATSTRLAGLVGAVTGLEAAALPIMWRYPLAEAMAEQGEADALPRFRGRTWDLGLLGEWRPEKGGRLALDALRHVFAAHPSLSVLLQVRDAAQAAEVQDALAGTPGDGKVAVIAGTLGFEEFEAAVGACHLLLLPYNPERYVGRVSGLLVEAAAWGRPAIVPAGTWMADMIGEGRAAGVLFDRFAAEVIGEAVVRALGDREALEARARTLAAPWRAAERMERTVEAILAWAGVSS